MAAFSYHPAFLLDSIFLPNTPSNNINIDDDHFSPSYPSEPLIQEVHNTDSRAVESSCTVDHSSAKVSLSDNEPSVTKKQSTESSTVVDKLETGEQVTQKVTSMDKKRKNRNGSSLNSAQSKV